MIACTGSVRPVPRLFVLTPLQYACRHAVRHKTSLVKVKEAANAPDSSLPGPLDVPAREPGQHILKYALQSGRAYLRFYKDGVKSVWNNHKQATSILDRVEGLLEKSGRIADTELPCTRREFQLVVRSQHDMRRVPAFALLLLIIGEWLPLVVVFVDNIVPWPCRIPRQVEHAERKLQHQRLQGRRLLLDTPLHSQPAPKGNDQLKSLDTLRLDLKAAINNCHKYGRPAANVYFHHALANFNMRSPLWDRRTAYSGKPWPPWKRKLLRRLKYIRIDDGLLLRDGGGVDALNSQNVSLACSERGIDILDKNGRFRSESALRADLKAWLDQKRSTMWYSMFLYGKVE